MHHIDAEAGDSPFRKKTDSTDSSIDNLQDGRVFIIKHFIIST
jgi:hypothetical protein